MLVLLLQHRSQSFFAFCLGFTSELCCIFLAFLFFLSSFLLSILFVEDCLFTKFFLSFPLLSLCGFLSINLVVIDSHFTLNLGPSSFLLLFNQSCSLSFLSFLFSLLLGGLFPGNCCFSLLLFSPFFSCLSFSFFLFFSERYGRRSIHHFCTHHSRSFFIIPGRSHHLSLDPVTVW